MYNNLLLNLSFKDLIKNSIFRMSSIIEKNSLDFGQSEAFHSLYSCGEVNT